jgi:hypothetical protein
MDSRTEAKVPKQWSFYASITRQPPQKYMSRSRWCMEEWTATHDARVADVGIGVANMGGRRCDDWSKWIPF